MWYAGGDDKPCPVCHGAKGRKVRCDACYGGQRRLEERYGNQKVVRYVTCTVCEGTNEVWQTCVNCQGTGTV